MDLSDMMIAYLHHLEVEYVFGVPGGGIAPFYNALARSHRGGGPRAVVARHETGAAFMAAGYARETGKPGVCATTTGPGATNIITGVASAYNDDVPLLVITGQTALPGFGRGAFQDSSYDAIDTVGMFSSCTHYNSMITHPEQMEPKLAAALMKALRHPMGPVHLSVPIDVFRYHWDGCMKFPHLKELLAGTGGGTIDTPAVENLYRDLLQVMEQNRRVVLLLGPACREAVDEIETFARMTGAGIVTTPMGKSCVDSCHPQLYGVFGFAGHESARSLLLDESVGIIMAVGTNLDEWATACWDTNCLLNHNLVHIHNSHAYFTRSPMARLHVAGNIGHIFRTLINRLETGKHGRPAHAPGAGMKEKESRPHPAPSPDPARPGGYRENNGFPGHIEIQSPHLFLAEPGPDGPVKPQRLMHELVRRFPPETRFLADTGNSFAWTTHYLFPAGRNTYSVGMSFGSMGWAVGASVGTAFGTPGTPVVCITGDGSFLMYGPDISVAVREELTVIFVVLNDAALGMVKQGQRLAGDELYAVELPAVDFRQFAGAMGADAYRIECHGDLEQLDIEALCARRGPVLLEVYVDREEVPPMKMRTRALKNARPDQRPHGTKK
ncbi:MAG: thiamine pyrophosphate-binding protein [bacterium]|nr:thiamine pyrophosphate-binding protein [bacterium]